MTTQTPEAQVKPAPQAPSPALDAKLPWATTRWVLGAVALLLLFRRPEQLLLPQFWADDGTAYFQQAMELGGARTLLRPYQGYLHLIPRLLAWAANSLPILWRPAFYGWSAFALTLGVAGLICRYCRLELPGGALTRALFVLAMLLVPHDGEVFLTLAALQWVIAPLLALLILQRPAATRAQHWGDVALVLAGGLTGPLLPLLLPLFAFRWALHGRPGRGDFFLGLSALAASAVQVWTVAHSARAQLPSPTHHWKRWTYAVGYQLPGRLFFGLELPEMFGAAFWIITPVLVATGVALWLAAAGDQRRRRLALAFMGTAALFYAAAIRPGANDPRIFHPLLAGARYFYVPYVMTLWTLLLLRQTPGWPQRTADTLLTLTLLAAATHFSHPLSPDYHWAETARRLERGERILVRFPPSWGTFSFESKPAPSSAPNPP